MKRSLLLIALLIGGVCAAGLAQAAEETPASSKNWLASSATLMQLGRGDVSSSKFEEYRAVPKNISMPRFSLAGHVSGVDFALRGENVSQRDQRYKGFVGTPWFKVTFDYIQIMHNIGFGGGTFFNETAPGVWSMSSTLRGLLQTTWEKTPSTARSLPLAGQFLGSDAGGRQLCRRQLQRNCGTYAVEYFGLKGAALHPGQCGWCDYAVDVLVAWLDEFNDWRDTSAAGRNTESDWHRRDRTERAGLIGAAQSLSSEES